MWTDRRERVVVVEGGVRAPPLAALRRVVVEDVDLAGRAAAGERLGVARVRERDAREEGAQVGVVPRVEACGDLEGATRFYF